MRNVNAYDTYLLDINAIYEREIRTCIADIAHALDQGLPIWADTAKRLPSLMREYSRVSTRIVQAESAYEDACYGGYKPKPAKMSLAKTPLLND